MPGPVARVARRILIAVAVVVLLGGLLALVPPPGERNLRRFDPDATAVIETAMWQAYYRKQKVRLFVLLVRMLRHQYHYSWARAAQAGFHLARAASRFSEMRGDYDRLLPDLERAFALGRRWTGAGFDPAQVARAELAFWVARRTPGHDSPAEVGFRIAELYARFYGVPRRQVLEAGRLRAEAAALRDRGGVEADWEEVARLLRKSFRSLHDALNP